MPHPGVARVGLFRIIRSHDYGWPARSRPVQPLGQPTALSRTGRELRLQTRSKSSDIQLSARRDRTMKRCLALLALLSSTSMLAQDGTFRVTVLSYQWTTSHNPVSFTWQGHSNTSCNGTSNGTGYASGSGTFSANGTSYESCSTTFTPPNTQTIDVQKPVVFVLAETANSRMVLSCTRNVRWSQCEALSPGFWLARFDRGHFEVQGGNSKGKAYWVRFDVVQQSAIQHPVPQPVPETEAKVVSAPIGSDDAARVASYRQECSNGDMQGDCPKAAYNSACQPSAACSLGHSTKFMTSVLRCKGDSVIGIAVACLMLQLY